jgi:lipopolysaccharide export system protein LptA
MNKRTMAWGCRLVAICLMAGPALAQKKAETTAPAGDSDVTVITSDKLTFDYMKQYAFFEKNVVVVDPQMKIFADTMMVLFDSDNKAKSIKAEGNVIIVQEDKRARAAVAEYKVDSGEITLTGEPMVTRGRDILTADVIKFWRDDNRMECKPRARLVIYPDNDSRRDNLFGEPKRD